MTMTDPVADMLTRLRNDNPAHHDDISLAGPEPKNRIAKNLKCDAYSGALK